MLAEAAAQVSMPPPPPPPPPPVFPVELPTEMVPPRLMVGGGIDSDDEAIWGFLSSAGTLPTTGPLAEAFRPVVQPTLPEYPPGWDAAPTDSFGEGLRLWSFDPFSGHATPVQRGRPPGN